MIRIILLHTLLLVVGIIIIHAAVGFQTVGGFLFLDFGAELFIDPAAYCMQFSMLALGQHPGQHVGQVLQCEGNTGRSFDGGAAVFVEDHRHGDAFR